MIVYKYRLAAPHGNADAIFQQMRLAHTYRNTLVEIENGRRDAVRAAESRFGRMPVLSATLQSAEAVLVEALTQLKRARSSERRRAETADHLLKVKEARAAKKTALEAFRAERERLSERCSACRKADGPSPCLHATVEAVALLHEKDRIGDLVADLRRNARAYCGLGSEGPFAGAWGSYLLSEAAVEQAIKTTPMYDRSGGAQNVRFARWDGGGSLQVQIQGGASVEEVTSGQNSQLKIGIPSGEPRPGEHWVHAPRRIRKEASRHGELALRLGTFGAGAGEVQWGRWRVDMFRRPIPAGAIVKRAVVHRERVGPFFQWYLTLTLDGVADILAPAGAGVVAVDIGWRVMGREIRAAKWRDSDGRTGELRLSEEDIRLLRAPQEIRSQRDSALELTKLSLSGWLARSEKLPAWLQGTDVMYWRSPDRMERLLRTWSSKRFAGDEIPYASLEAFCGMDRLRWATEAKWRQSALLRRRETYRIFAAKLAEGYGTLVLESDDAGTKAFDLRVFAEKAAVEDPAENKTARSNRVLVASYELRRALSNAFLRRGRNAGLVPARDTTRTCAVCGLVQDRGAEEAVVLSCECGAVFDQDDGACAIMLQRWFERGGGDETPGGARKGENTSEDGPIGESKWGRARRKGAEKKQRRGGARDADREAAE